MNDEITFWSGFNSAVSNFCLEASIACKSDPGKVISSLVGDELEWCGSYSFMFLATNYTEMQRRSHKSEDRCKELERALSNEKNICSTLRKQLKQIQLAAADNEWQLQEQLAHCNNLLIFEKETTSDLRHQISSIESKLVEVEMYLSTDRGAVSLQLEQDLASAKLRIADLEADKDDLELELRKRNNNSNNNLRLGKLRESSNHNIKTTSSYTDNVSII